MGTFTAVALSVALLTPGGIASPVAAEDGRFTSFDCTEQTDGESTIKVCVAISGIKPAKQLVANRELENLGPQAATFQCSAAEPVDSLRFNVKGGAAPYQDAIEDKVAQAMPGAVAAAEDSQGTAPAGYSVLLQPGSKARCEIGLTFHRISGVVQVATVGEEDAAETFVFRGRTTGREFGRPLRVEGQPPQRGEVTKN